MYFILPKKGITFDEMAEKLASPGYWDNTTGQQTTTNVELYIPKFKLEYKCGLIETLKAMGMSKSFDRLLASFPNITADKDKFFVNKIDQKTVIQVDEKGTEAAAVTEIGIDSSTGQVIPQNAVFRADRPFLFLIQENSTGIILFIGKVGDPTKT
jgi:serpin B